MCIFFKGNLQSVKFLKDIFFLRGCSSRARGGEKDRLSKRKKSNSPLAWGAVREREKKVARTQGAKVRRDKWHKTFSFRSRFGCFFWSAGNCNVFLSSECWVWQQSLICVQFFVVNKKQVFFFSVLISGPANKDFRRLQSREKKGSMFWSESDVSSRITRVFETGVFTAWLPILQS